MLLSTFGRSLCVVCFVVHPYHRHHHHNHLSVFLVSVVTVALSSLLLCWLQRYKLFESAEFHFQIELDTHTHTKCTYTQTIDNDIDKTIHKTELKTHIFFLELRSSSPCHTTGTYTLRITTTTTTTMPNTMIVATAAAARQVEYGVRCGLTTTKIAYHWTEIEIERKEPNGIQRQQKVGTFSFQELLSLCGVRTVAVNRNHIAQSNSNIVLIFTETTSFMLNFGFGMLLQVTFIFHLECERLLLAHR